jgi:IS5 family transposase
MLGRRERQGSFWDSEWIEHLIDRESFEWHFRRVVRPLISDEDFAWAYSSDRGRAAIPPSLVACALILQQRYRLSDREMERQVRFNLATKYALGLPMDDEGFDHTVLCKFRGMLVESDRAKLCFDRFREALVSAGLIQAGETAVIDTTHVIADIAIPNTIELVRMGVKGVLRAAGGIPAGVGNQLAKNLDLGVVFEPSRHSEGKDHLVELVVAARRLISYLEKSGDASHPDLRESLDHLRRILQENTRERVRKRGRGEWVVVEEREGPTPDRLVSTVDPDARHGRKSEEKKFVGYKAQIVEGEQGFITAIEGMLGNRHDSWGVGEMVAELAGAGIKPEWLVGDGAYHDEELGTSLERAGVRVVAPLKDFGGGVFPNDLFEYRDDGPVPLLRCPAGEGTAASDRSWKGRLFHFTHCGGCSLRSKCTSGQSRSVLISRSYFFRKRKAAFNGTAVYKDLMRQRAKIERKNGQLKNGFGMRRCRYRGLAKFRFQCFFSALAANIQRLVSIFITAPPGNPAFLAVSA